MDDQTSALHMQPSGRSRRHGPEQQIIFVPVNADFQAASSVAFAKTNHTHFFSSCSWEHNYHLSSFLVGSMLGPTVP